MSTPSDDLVPPEVLPCPACHHLNEAPVTDDAVEVVGHRRQPMLIPPTDGSLVSKLSTANPHQATPAFSPNDRRLKRVSA